MGDYLSIQQIEADRQLRAGDDPKRLEHFGFKVYSQSDEDGIIEEIFRRIGTTSRVFIDFGCETGQENNTRYLLEQGWTGLWMEAWPDYAQAVRFNALDAISSGQLKFIETAVTAENINELIASAGIQGEIDFLSIDIDGNDYHVLEAITVVQPRVLCLEHNHSYPPPIDWVMPYIPNHRWVQGSANYGASLVALERLAREKGMVLVGCGLYSSNGFYVRQDLVNQELFSAPFTSERFFNPLDVDKLFSFPPRQFVENVQVEDARPETPYLDADLLEKQKQLEAEIDHLQASSQQLQEKLVQLQNQFAAFRERSQKQQKELKSELGTAQGRIRAMESSKFWQLRQQWFRIKRLLHLSAE